MLDPEQVFIKCKIQFMLCFVLDDFFYENLVLQKHFCMNTIRAVSTEIVFCSWKKCFQLCLLQGICFRISLASNARDLES